MYKEITAKTALHKLNSDYLPYKWDLNIYRGCSHRCHYCFATYSHQYLDNANFFGTIYVKKNIAEVLEKKLSSSRWPKEVINLGGVTDSYQEAESEYQLMPKIWKLLIKYRTPAIISTKSKLLLRDIELIQELSTLVEVNVAATIITADEALRAVLEPGASTIAERFEMLKTIKEKTNCSIGVHTMPIIPFLNDSRENLGSIFRQAKEVNADYLITSGLNLYSETRKTFFIFIAEEYPRLTKPLQELYAKPFMKKEYRIKLYQLISELRKSYNIPSGVDAIEKVKHPEKEQLNLF